MNNLIAQYGVVPVVVLEDEKDALTLAEALVKGGLPVAEVTFRTAAAEGSIKAMCEAYPEMLVGAGTVLSVVWNQERSEEGLPCKEVHNTTIASQIAINALKHL